MAWNGIEKAQTVLRMVAVYDGAIDGDVGRLSLAAAERVEGTRFLDNGRPITAARIVIAAAQIALAQAGHAVGGADGYWGPSTDAAYELWAADLAGVPLVDRTGETSWGRAGDLVRRYGAPGSAICTQGKVRPPWAMVLAWDESQSVSTISCHAEVAGSLGLIFEHIADTHTPAQIEALGLHLYGGCYNDRLMRGGSQKSIHAWGLALDFDPAHNRLHWGRDRARLAMPDADRFWRIWTAEGWTSLGRAKNYDWMHVQAPAL